MQPDNKCCEWQKKDLTATDDYQTREVKALSTKATQV